MASGSGGRPDLKSTLGSLLRTTLEHVGAVKDVVETQARAQGGMVDQALLQRRKKEALLRLGEAVFRLSERGMLGELALDPEIGTAVAQVEATLSESEKDELQFASMARPSGDEAVSSANYRPPWSGANEKGPYRVWRPVMPEDEDNQQAATSDSAQDEVTASEFTENSEAQAAPPETTKDEAATGAVDTIPGVPVRRLRRKGPANSAIHFATQGTSETDPDDDLAAYMHEDDVPD